MKGLGRAGSVAKRWGSGSINDERGGEGSGRKKGLGEG